MYDSKYNLNPSVFDNLFTEIHRIYLTVFSRSTFKEPKIFNKTNSFAMSLPFSWVIDLRDKYIQGSEKKILPWLFFLRN